MVGRGRCHQMSGEGAAYRQRVVALLERKSIGSLQVPSSSCRPEQNANLLLCTTFARVKGALKVKGEGSPVVTERWRYHKRQQNRTMKNGLHGSLQLGRLRNPSTRRDAGSRGDSPRATGAGQKSAGCEGCVHQVCRPRSGVQKGRTLPLRVWVSRPHVDGG